MNLEEFKTILTDRITAAKPVIDNNESIPDNIEREEFNRFFKEQCFALKMIAVVEAAKDWLECDSWDKEDAELRLRQRIKELERE